ncbi:MAG: hypothetical protein D6741_16225, partial [Planctomycetota bacterium]
PVLGGDPQLAYHFALLWIGRLVCRFLLDLKSSRFSGSSPTRTHRRVLLASLIAFACAGVLAAVQVLPSAEYTQRSDRAVIASRLSAWSKIAEELRSSPDPSPAAGKAASPLGAAAETSLASLDTIPYQFSIGWWRLGELLWPNFGGRPFPRNQRWMEAVPAEGRLWCPSLYQGLIPLLMALAGLRFIPARGRFSAGSRVFLSWTVLLAVLLSMGWYGLGWWLRELRIAGGDGIAPPVGGLYWILVTLAPGYAHFRYPAKWFTFVAFGIALLSAIGTTELLRSRRFRRRLTRLLAGTAIASLVVFVPWMVFRERWIFWFAQTDPHPIFGPLDAIGAHRIAAVGMTQALLVAAALATVLRLSRPSRRRRRLIGVAIVVLTAVDLAIANGWLVVTTPPSFQQETPLITELPEIPDARTGESADCCDAIPLRIDRRLDWFPRRWRFSSSDNRLRDWLRWEQATLAPKRHLLCPPLSPERRRAAVVESFGTMLAADYLDVLLLAAADAPARSDKPLWFDDLVGAAVRLRPSRDQSVPASQQQAGDAASAAPSSWKRTALTWEGEPIDVLRRAPLPHAFLV